MKALIILLALAGLLPTDSGAPARTQDEGGRRIAPPARLACPRDRTTSFTGRVLAYRRGAGRVFVRVRTDEETTEEFTLRYGRRGDPRRLFLLRGETFGQSDWRRIERRTGALRPGMRATVWACYVNDDPRAELIDWRPPER